MLKLTLNWDFSIPDMIETGWLLQGTSFLVVELVRNLFSSPDSVASSQYTVYWEIFVRDNIIF